MIRAMHLKGRIRQVLKIKENKQDIFHLICHCSCHLINDFHSSSTIIRTKPNKGAKSYQGVRNLIISDLSHKLYIKARGVFFLPSNQSFSRNRQNKRINKCLISTISCNFFAPFYREHYYAIFQVRTGGI